MFNHDSPTAFFLCFITVIEKILISILQIEKGNIAPRENVENFEIVLELKK